MSREPERLLLVIEHQDTRLRLADQLNAQGYAIDTVTSYADATQLLREAEIDLVLGDIGIADLSDSFLELINTTRNFLPFIALVTDQSAASVMDIMARGAVTCAQMPRNGIDALLSIVRRQLEIRHYILQGQSFQSLWEHASRELKAGLDELRADQRAGLRVQQKMFPEKERQFGPVHCSHLMLPSLYLSGDFCDYISLGADKVMFYIADVSGHGASSAFVTVLLKNLTNRLQRNLKRKSSDDILYPDRFLARVNQELLDTHLGKHLTMFAGVLDTETRELTYAVGAHFPMPILVTDEGAAYLTGRGLPVGLFEDASHEIHRIQLPERFSLVLFSDGILEILPKTSLTDRESLLLDYASSACGSIETLSHRFGLDETGELPDDIAIMLVTNAAEES